MLLAFSLCAADEFKTQCLNCHHEENTPDMYEVYLIYLKKHGSNKRVKEAMFDFLKNPKVPDTINSDKCRICITIFAAGGGPPIVYYKGRMLSEMFTLNTIIDETPPAEVSGLKIIEKTTNYVKLEWTNPADPDFQGVSIRFFM